MKKLKKLANYAKEKLLTFIDLLLATKIEDSRRKVMQYSAYLLIVIIVNFFVGKNLANIDYAWYSNVSIFLLVNINIILMLMLMLVIFRNLAKLIAESRSKLFGANLKVKLVIFSITITVVPIVIFYFFAVTIVNSSINRWFDSQVDSALSSSVSLMEDYERMVRDNLLSQSNLISQVLSSHNVSSSLNKQQLEQIFDGYINKELVDGIYIFNTKKDEILTNNYLNTRYLNDISKEYINSVLRGNHEQGYQFDNDQKIFWIGIPVDNNLTNDGIIKGAIFAYKMLPKDIVSDITMIQDSRHTYREGSFFSHPIRKAYYMMLLLMAMLVIFAGIWGSMLFSSSITKPIEELAEASVELSKGNMRVTVEEKGSDEIKYLIKTFNSMTKQLDTHTKELHSKNETLSEMFSQISRDKIYIDAIFKNVNSIVILLSHNLEVIKANDKADSFIVNKHLRSLININNAIQTFISSDEQEHIENIELTINNDTKIFSMILSKLIQDNEENILLVLSDITDMLNAQRISVWREIATNMAHEIKNPLTPIKLLAERVKKKSSSLQDNQFKGIISESMDTIITETDGLLELVEDFNLLARLPQAKRVDIDMARLILEVKLLYTESYPNVKINTHGDGEFKLKADRLQIKRVIQNLIVNAISAINQEGVIDISLNNTDKNVIVTITDNGSGIKGEDIHKIFEPYYTKRSGGTGLGLAIVKKIIDEHEGKISVESIVDNGATFTITLPKGI